MLHELFVNLHHLKHHYEILPIKNSYKSIQIVFSSIKTCFTKTYNYTYNLETYKGNLSTYKLSRERKLFTK